MNMFKPTDANSPEAYIAMIDEPRRSDFQQLHDLICKTVPTLKPHITYGMIGYGTYRYRYASGREGDWSLVCLASQKQYISLYVSCLVEEHYLAEEYKDRLPKAKIGKSCIRFKRLSDVDINVLRDVITRATEIGGAGQTF